ncbi:hypothetical protein CC2G_008653 [Coprinopsis cinerea AmutBmut pab1-1]|nr:hypothetical protein CC2G_008653 [Coprinopsis cinerea AmutBmut pab1-1]
MARHDIFPVAAMHGLTILHSHGNAAFLFDLHDDAAKPSRNIVHGKEVWPTGADAQPIESGGDGVDEGRGMKESIRTSQPFIRARCFVRRCTFVSACGVSGGENLAVTLIIVICPGTAGFGDVSVVKGGGKDGELFIH